MENRSKWKASASWLPAENIEALKSNIIDPSTNSSQNRDQELHSLTPILTKDLHLRRYNVQLA